ncbi:MAG: hypothetical protein ABI237_05805 [Ginsengibacter sp.]
MTETDNGNLFFIIEESLHFLQNIKASQLVYHLCARNKSAHKSFEFFFIDEKDRMEMLAACRAGGVAVARK